MKLPRFDYASPTTVQQAVALLAAGNGSARLLAGGQSLVPILAFRLAAPSMLIDLGRVAGLDTIAIDDAGVCLGARVRWCDIETDARLSTAHPLLAAAIVHVAHYTIRKRGTVGGSLAHADPAAELPAVCAAHDAVVHVASVRGIRQIAFHELGSGFMATTLAPDEMIAAIDLQVWRQGHGHGFHEFARRQGDFALAGATALLDIGADNVVRRATLTLFGVATSPVRVEAAEARLTGQPLTSGAIRAASAAARQIEPISDIHASGEYRRHLAQVLSSRALNDAAQRAGVQA
jgi:aerobic carbon-monoxide dehydrogenase medium subunit